MSAVPQGIVAPQVGLHGAQSEAWYISATVPASASATTSTQATIQRQATSGTLTQQFCPVREVWHVERIYFVGTNPVPDCQIVIFVDLVQQPYTPAASSINLSLNRPAALSRTIIIPPGSVIAANIVNVAANAVTAGVSVTFTMQVMRWAM